MSDPNTPRAEGTDPADQSADGFAVTGEQHATPSAPAAPGVGEPAQSFSSAPVPPEQEAPGQPAFSAGEGSQSWQQSQQPGSDGAPSYGQASSAPTYGQSGQQSAAPGQGGAGQPLGGQPPHAQQNQPGPSQYGAPGQPGPSQYGAPGQPGQQYGAPGQPGQPQYGAPGQPQYSAAAPMSPVDEKNAGMWGHLSGLSTVITGGFGGWIGPLIVFLIYKDRSAFARQESKEALNFGIFMTILAVGIMFVGILLAIPTFGLLGFISALYWIPGLLQAIFSIIGGMRVNGGGSYRYPFNWRLVK
ncbi:DUF4870 domain-containing protein [Agrococcus sp. Ld7]|uniref:DUF4870 domain-containing protein n=1 Tax=Agrococcus sp. Ld7 TaxID=649148 RepID=UPI00386AA533